MIKLVVFDFDGVFTNGKIYFDSCGNPIKHYNAKDGMGISILKKNGFITGVISGWKYNSSQEYILNHIGINNYIFSCNNKKQILLEWCKELNISTDEVAYMGDDINDIELINSVSISACPNDAVEQVRNSVDIICTQNGGDGAIREFCDYLSSKYSY
jgi:3-deoxy-D-manno-octulosonate 8-phosphate phosphatase (KDO 8-P phosphatase)